MGGKVGSGSDWGPGEKGTDTRAFLVSESRDGGVGIDIARRDSTVNISYFGDLFVSHCELVVCFVTTVISSRGTFGVPPRSYLPLPYLVK